MPIRTDARGKGVYSPADRVLTCEQCGAPAPVPVPDEGGTVACDACGMASIAPPRPETRVPHSPSTDFSGRLARLRLQDGRPLATPPWLEGILPGSMIMPAKMREIRLIWGQTRRRLLVDPSGMAAAERLVVLTMAIVNVLITADDDRAMRAVLEGALEVFMLPRHRQLMRAPLGRRAAVREALINSVLPERALVTP